MVSTKPVKRKKYKLTISLNGKVINKQTDNIKDTLKNLSPEFLYTEAFFSIKDNKTKEVIDRRLNLIQSRKLFNDDVFLDIFINNLLLE